MPWFIYIKHQVNLFKYSGQGEKKKKEQTLSTSEYFSTFYLGATLGTFVSGPIALIRERAWGISPLQVGQSG